MSSFEPTNTEPTTSTEPQAAEEESGAVFEPVIKLDEKVEVKTFEEDEEPLFKMYVDSSGASGGALEASREVCRASDAEESDGDV